MLAIQCLKRHCQGMPPLLHAHTGGTVMLALHQQQQQRREAKRTLHTCNSCTHRWEAARHRHSSRASLMEGRAARQPSGCRASLQFCQKPFLSTPFKSPFATHLRQSGIWKSCSQTLQGFQP